MQKKKEEKNGFQLAFCQGGLKIRALQPLSWLLEYREKVILKLYNVIGQQFCFSDL